MVLTELIGVVIVILSNIVVFIVFITNLKNKIDSVKSDLKLHSNNNLVHRSLEEDVKLFVTRYEYTRTNEDIKEIKNDVKKLLKIKG